ncbi:hypothetical protein [Methanosarcina horonobensis]|uniref:hypothetical protein n=1 Tax=Methanosarcina horonobensis TaxID=418008 RepID=UPI000B22D6C3|nr:hypothetical protein [Methanosarcina horonobensis]
MVYVSLGFGGRGEITRAVTSILKEVKAGYVRPEDVDEKKCLNHISLSNMNLI